MLKRTKNLALVLLMASFCHAHQDAILSISSSGAITGLPPQFGNAAVQIKFTDPIDKFRPIESLTLIIGNKKIEFPRGLVGILRTQRISSIRATASWYHQSMLPHYLKMDFANFDNDPDSEMTPHISILFNLQTVKIMRITAILPNGSDEGLQNFPIDLKALCLPELYPKIADTKTKLVPYL